MDSQKTSDFSLKQQCKTRIKNAIDQIKHQNKSIQTFILIADSKALHMISSYMKMMELMEMSILAVDKLENERKDYPKQHVIYFLCPEQGPIDLLIEDFQGKKRKYGHIHLLFTNAIAKSQMTKISQCQLLMERVITFKEINIDFTCKFDNIFNFEIDDALRVLFSEQASNKYTPMIFNIASKLSTLIGCFEKIYGIEIICQRSLKPQDRDTQSLCEQIGEQVSRRMENLMFGLKKENSETLDSSAGKITVILVDRTFDPLSPLLHDFYYQPLMYDCLNIENDIVEYEVESKNSVQKKKTLLEDNDDIFNKYRYQHIAHVAEGINTEFQKFVNNNATAKVQKGQMQNLDFNKMSEIVKSMPQYQTLLNKYTLHFKLLEDTWSYFENKDLKQLGDIEQTLATGKTEDGDVMKFSKLMAQIGNLLDGDVLSQNEKLRLVLITAICHQLSEKERRVLTERLDNQDALLNLHHLGVSAQQSNQKKQKKLNDQKKSKHVQNRMSEALILSRNANEIEMLVGDLLQANQPQAAFKQTNDAFKHYTVNLGQYSPTKKNATSLRKNKFANIVGKQEDEDASSNQVPKVIVCYIGGMSHNEVRTLRSLERQDLSMIVGGTSILKPSDYTKGLESMKSGLDF